MAWVCPERRWRKGARSLVLLARTFAKRDQMLYERCAQLERSQSDAQGLVRCGARVLVKAHVSARAVTVEEEKAQLKALFCALGGTRIPNLLIRSQMLCPIELRAQSELALYL